MAVLFLNIKRRVLFTGGRAPVTLDLARSFSKSGHDVFVADSFPYQLTKVSNQVIKAFTITSPVHSLDSFLSDLKEIIQTYQIDLLIPTCEETFYIAKGKIELEKYCSVFCEDIETLNTFHNKYTFIQYVATKGLPIPNTSLIQSHDQLKEQVRHLRTDTVMKPIYSRFGTDVIFLKQGKNPPSFSITKTNPFILQEEIKGSPICNYVVLINGEIKASANYTVTYTTGRAAIYFEHTSHPRIDKWLHTFFENTTFTGQFSFDFIESEDGEIYPIECNPRTTSGIHLFYQQDIATAFINPNQTLFTPLSDTKRMIGFAMLPYGFNPKRFYHFWRTFFKAKDIIWERDDLKPFFYQIYTYLRLFQKGRKLKVSTIEASTVDIEWNGDIK